LKKLIVDFLPLLVFFIAYKYFDIYVATGATIAATLAQVAYLKITGQKVEAMHWLGLVIVVVFGGLTIWLKDQTFIQWKPTVLYWTFAVILIGGKIITGKNYLRSLLGSQLELPNKAWDNLAWMWIGFFAFMGALNIYIAQNYSMDQWVTFKVWWSVGLIVVFSIIQGVYLTKFVDATSPIKSTDGLDSASKSEVKK
jgi:intracellular septation protein